MNQNIIEDFVGDLYLYLFCSTSGARDNGSLLRKKMMANLNQFIRFCFNRVKYVIIYTNLNEFEVVLYENICVRIFFF